MAYEELHVVGEELLGYKAGEGVDTADKMASWLDQQPPLVVATTCISYPPNIEELVQKSIANTPVKIDEWMTKDLVDELKLVRPDTLDIDSDGNRDVNALEAKCESFFYLNRHFCNARQLEAALHVFSNLWGFTIARYGMGLFCHYAPPKQKKELVENVEINVKSRKCEESAKEKMRCPFSIKFSYVTTRKKNSIPDWMFNSDGQIKHPDSCYPVKITCSSCIHSCSPGVASQRFAMKRSGCRQIDIESLGEMVHFVREAGGIDNRMLRNLLRNLVPNHVALTDQYLRNFRTRLMKFVLDPSSISKRNHDIEQLIEGRELAANETTTFDEALLWARRSQQ
jgi:hypothetical protein